MITRTPLGSFACVGLRHFDPKASSPLKILPTQAHKIEVSARFSRADRLDLFHRRRSDARENPPSRIAAWIVE
ncbi:MAG: hypothetical protein U1E25_03305 [Methylocystis sp.]